MNDQEKNPPAEPSLPPSVIELARSGRSKCKTCRRMINKGTPRLGVRIEGPFGVGYIWHHLNCGAKRQMERVEEAYVLLGPEPAFELPPLAHLRTMVEKAELKKKQKKTVPYLELSPTGRSRCKRCDQAIEKGSYRVIMLRKVEFYGQVRHGPVNIHPGCVMQELASEDSASEPDTLLDGLRANSSGVDPSDIERVIQEIGIDS